MKQGYINILAVCMTLMIAAACDKEQNPSPNPKKVTYDDLTISGIVTTKTVLNNDNTVDWSVGDAISVFSTNISGGNNKFNSSHSAIIHETVFSGKIETGTTGVVALYPYTASAAYSGGTVTGMSIPTTQAATESSFANGASVTIAKGTKAADAKTVTLTFQNLCSVLKFTVPEGIKTSSSIRVESINSAVKMSGAVSINSSTESITSAATAYVDLSGTFSEGKTYCVTVAPGNYDQGFRFTITGTNGTTLVREAPAVNAEKGKVYSVGALNPVISGDPVTCEISHTYQNGTLTGSDATITLSAPQDEFASNIKGWRLDNVTIKSQDGTVTYRTLTDGTSSVNGQPIALSQVSGLPYMPHGSYTFSADIYYTVNKADGTPAEKLFKQNFTKTVTSPSPDASKFTLAANISGYTSYSCYKGTDGQSASTSTANSKDNSTIYDVGATYAGGLSTDVYNQCLSLLSVSPTLDNNVTTSGDKTGQSWASHTIGASATFDGVTQTCAATRTVHVTGLPYSAVPPRSNEWSGQTKKTGLITNVKYDWTDSYLEMEGGTQSPITNGPHFYIPNEFPVKVSGKIIGKGIRVIAWIGSDVSVKLGGGDPDNSNTWCVKHTFKEEAEWNYNMESYNMTSSKNFIEIEHSYGAAGPYTRVYSVYVQYR